VLKGWQAEENQMFRRKNIGSTWVDQAKQTQEAFRSYFELIDPRASADSAKELTEITEAVARAGEWSKDDEWRISTWMQVLIKAEMVQGKQWFRVTVDCDGQSLSCRCQTIERAFAFYKLYAHIIIYQFYAVGPPWAG
jgi:hypothetical protein